MLSLISTVLYQINNGGMLCCFSYILFFYTYCLFFIMFDVLVLILLKRWLCPFF